MNFIAEYINVQVWPMLWIFDGNDIVLLFVNIELNVIQSKILYSLSKKTFRQHMLQKTSKPTSHPTLLIIASKDHWPYWY